MRYEFRIMAFTLHYFKLSEFFGMTAQERSATRRSTLIGVVIAAPLCFGFDQISRHFGLSERLSALGMFFLGLLSLCGAAFVAGALWPDLMKEAEENFEKRTAKRNLAENAEQRAVTLQAEIVAVIVTVAICFLFIPLALAYGLSGTYIFLIACCIFLTSYLVGRELMRSR
jgi:hypothetical protein